MGARLHRALARLMPAAFRREYGDEMCRVAEEQWADVRTRAGRIGATWFWARQSAALVRAAVGLRRHEHGTTGGVTMDGFMNDVRHAAKGLVRRPWFSAVTTLTLGLGIGAATAIFSAVNAVLLRPLPYADDERVAVLFTTDLTTGARGEGVAAANVHDFRESATLFEAVSVAEPWSLDLEIDGRAESLRTWSVAEGFFEAIGGQALLGRTFTDRDYADGDAAIVILGHRAWVERFGSDRSILGRSLTLDGEARIVIGVMPSAFRFPDAAELWIPRLEQPWDASARAADFMTGVARLAPGVSLAQAQSEADRIGSALREAYPDLNVDTGYTLVPLREHLFGDVRTPLWVMMAAVGFLLLIACANVAGLMLARGAQRERDYALRGALGAGTGRMISHVSAEALLLAVTGCCLGIVLTYGGVAAIRALGPDHLPRIDELSVDGTVLAFAVAVAGLSALVSGLAPTLRLSRPDLRGALGDGSRGTGSVVQARARSRLVVVQVAAAVLLLAGAGLLLRSFGVLLDKELGFDPADRLAVQIFAYDYASAGERNAFLDEAVALMEALPGVTGVAIASDVPGTTDGVIAKIDITVPFTIVDRAAPPAGQEPMVSISQVSERYFDVLDIEVVAGREFDATDDAAGVPVLAVNEAFARRHFGDADPVGSRLLVQFGNTPVPREIVGVVADTRPFGYASAPRPEAYLPLAQVPSGSLIFVVRATGDADVLTLPAMEAVWSANPSQSVWGAAPMESLLAEGLRERRFTLFLLSAFSLIALTLATVGLYGLVSFSVERRIGELGIRRALGGRAEHLVAMVLAEGARLAGIGLVLGLGASLYLSRFIQGMLFEVEPTDPLTLVLLGMLVLATATLATVVPALRAVRVDPVQALRSE